MQDAAKFAESTQILMNVSEFTDVSQATDTLISAVQAFGYTADTSMEVVDLLNIIGNNYAISTADLAQSLTKSSASLVAAGGDLAEAAALTATANAIVQDADSVGTALKTTSLRLRGTDVKTLDDEGLDSEGAVTSKSKLRGKVKAISGVDILTETGEYKSTYEILSQIADVWSDINDMDQAALLELISGKRNASVVAAILQSPEELKQAYEDAQNAEGSALKENEKYLDSIQGRIDLFTNSIQTMWSNALSSDAVKTIVNLGTGIIKIIDNVGLLQLALASLLTYISTKFGGLNFSKIFSGLTLKGVNRIFGKSVNKDIQSTTSKLEELEQSVRDAKQAYIDDGGSKSSKKALKEAEESLETYKKLQKEGFKQTDSSKSYFGTEIQKIKDYKKELQAVEEASTQAQQNLARAQANLDNYQGTDPKKLYKYQDGLKRAQVNVNALDKKQADLKKTGSGAFQSLAKGADKFSQTIQSAIASMLVMYAVSKVIQLITAFFDKLVETAEEAKESFDELKSKLSTTESELSTLESKLEDITDQIKDINNNGPLTFTDQEELSRLKAESAELQRQIDLLNTIKEQQARGVNESAINAADKYAETGVKTGKTAGENIGGKAGSGALIGAGFGVASGVGGAVLSGATLGAWAGPLGMLLGAAIGAAIGAGVGAAVGGIQSATEETVGESLDNMRDQYTKLQTEFDVARENYKNDASDKNKEKFEEAQEALNKYKSNMADYISEMDAYYSQIRQNWDTATEEQKQAAIAWDDKKDEWAILDGGVNAKSNAITRIFGNDVTDELKGIKEKIEDAVKAGKDFELKDILTEEEYKAVLERITGIGVGVGDLASYFKDEYKAEVEAMNDTSTDSAVKEIANLTKGVKSLKDAFNELQTEGQMSADTLMGLKDIFGSTEGWSEFITTVSTGASTIEQMTEKAKELAENYINDKISPENWNPKEYLTYISHLGALGVTDPKGLLDKKLQQAAVEAFVNGTYKSIEEAEAAYSNEDHQVKIPDNVIEAAQKKKEAEEKAKETQGAYEEYNRQRTDKKNVAGRKARYESDLNLLKNVGAPENLEAAFENPSVTAEEVFRAAMSNAMPDAFKDLYENAKKAYEEGNNELLQQYLNNLAKYGVNTENIANAFEGGIDSESLWANFRQMPDEFKKAFDDAKEMYFAGIDVPEITASVVTEADVDAVEEEAKKAANAYQDAFDEYEFDIQLFDTNNLIDELQNVYDTLTNAAKEYAENGGYVSVDTLQTLLGLDAKYIGLLYNEQGQLELNTSSIQRMTQARIMEAAVLQATKYLKELDNAATDGNVAQLAALTTATDIATDSQWDFVDSQLAAIKVKMMDKGMSESDADNYIKKARHNIDSIRKLAETTSQNISNTISSSGNTAKAEADDAFKRAMDYWENRISANRARYEQVQNEIDLFEKRGQKANADYYREQVELEEQRRWLLEQQKAEAKQYLGTFKEGSDEWWEVAKTLNDIEGELDDVTASIVDLQDAIGEIDTYKFEEFNTRLDNLTSKLETIRNLIASNGEEDWFDDEGNWTEAGVAVLGSYIQELEHYKQGYQNTMDELAKYEPEYEGNKSYYEALGIHSEQEYYDKTQTLIDQQYDYANSINDTKQSIVDMYESSIDAIEEYTDKLVDGYNDYIDSVKEALDAERDLYDFKKNVQKQAKDISELERKIVSLSGSTNAADIASRRKLEADLYSARESLNDSYYDHAKDAQQDALDAEAQAYEESMTRFVEGLRISLETATANMDEFLMGVTSMLMYNADTILAKYEETNLPLTKELTNPWEEAKKAVGNYSGNALDLMNQWTREGGFFAQFNANGTTNLTSPWGAGTNAANAFKSSVSTVMSNVVSNISSNIRTASAELSRLYQQIQDTEKRAASANLTVNSSGGGGGAAPQKQYGIRASLQMSGKTLSVFGTSTVSEADAKNKAKLAIMGAYENYQKSKGVSEASYESSWLRSWQNKVVYTKATSNFAKGAKSLKHDQWAITDEPQFGDELVLVPTAQGNLSYMRKGTGVVPAKLTENLMEWGQFTPDSMSVGSGVNINMINNAVNKPEFNLSVENFLRCDNVSQDSLPELKRFVNEQVNSLVKQMNYAIKGKGGR